MYPVLWALKHAPCADIYEQMILLQMADAADEDGCNAYLSKESIADRIAGDIDAETVRRRWRAMERRGLIRPDTTPPPPRYLRLPANRRPRRWELCIPHSWWSDAQRERVQQGRADRGLEPLTPESRPDLAPAPAKKGRADKGKSRTPGATVSAPSKKAPGASSSGPQGPLAVAPRGLSQRPNHPLDHPLDHPPLPTLPAAEAAPPPGPVAGREDVNSEETNRALALVDDAVRRWPSHHRPPGPRDRQRLAKRVTRELADGGNEAVILDELTRDLNDAASAVRVLLGARTRDPGWGRAADPRPDRDRYTVRGPRPAWCGQCSERTRLVAAIREDGSEAMRRCPHCHPDRAAAGGPPPEETGADATLDQAMASLLGTIAGEGTDRAPAPPRRSPADAARRALESALGAE